MANPYWHFGTTSQSRLQGSRNPKTKNCISWALKMRATGYDETPVRNFLSTLRNTQQKTADCSYTRWISAALRPSACRKRITLRNSHLAGALIVAAIFTCPYLGNDWRIGADNGRGCSGGAAQSRDAQIWLPRISYFLRSTIGGWKKKKNSPRI